MKKGTVNKIFYIYLFICIFFITGLASGAEGDDENKQLPNPAARYSARMGYKYEIRNGNYGVVIFPDGTECNEWDFFRGKKGQKWSYCEQQGGKIENRVENMGTWTAEYAVCVFVDGSECKETDYLDGKCGPGI
ncbi:MAG: DUF333 domain-containing protein [Candidatus Omnitrophota bacterium]|nr:DUF333 domain-containing protein [Candidatus Omnitrophota bacterium]